MTTDDSDFQAELARRIAESRPLGEVLDLVVGFRHRGIAQEAVYLALQQLRASAPDEAYEDRVLDVMDFVWGWCHVSQRIWPSDLTDERMVAFMARSTR